MNSDGKGSMQISEKHRDESAPSEKKHRNEPAPVQLNRKVWQKMVLMPAQLQIDEDLNSDWAFPEFFHGIHRIVPCSAQILQN